MSTREKKRAFALFMLDGWTRKLWAMEVDGCDPLDVAEVRERARKATMNLRWVCRVVMKGGL